MAYKVVWLESWSNKIIIITIEIFNIGLHDIISPEYFISVDGMLVNTYINDSK